MLKEQIKKAILKHHFKRIRKERIKQARAIKIAGCKESNKLAKETKIKIKEANTQEERTQIYMKYLSELGKRQDTDHKKMAEILKW